jgi:hypothetical protein
LEFSGWMIVRPATSEARAVMRLQDQVIEHVPETHEYIVSIPPGHDENSYARYLMSTGDYQYVEPDWLCFPTQVTPNDPSYWQQWHHDKLGSPFAWSLERGGPSLTIAIVDSGIQTDHPDLAGALVSGYNSADDLAESAGGDISDVDGHGTYVAGLAGALGNNGAFVAGMGWDFRIMPVRYYNQPGGGYLHDITEGARWAAENGARCVNVSQTGVEHSSVQTTGTYLRNLDSQLFWAAGNDQRDLNWFDWTDVIVVGGTDPNDDKASFSAFGLAVDFYAPSTDIYSTGMPSALAIGSGTSAASPMVAGVAGLIWSFRPDLTPQQIEDCLELGSVDLGIQGEDPYWGWGRLDAEASLRACGIAEISVNGVRDHAYVFQGGSMEVEIGLEPGILEGEDCEFWILGNSTAGWMHFQPPRWLPGLFPSYQGPMLAIPPTTVLDWAGLPPGDHEFRFGVDMLVNGVPEEDEMILDSVTVTVW